MIDMLLWVQNAFLVMGLSTLDESMQSVLDTMASVPRELGSTVGMAKLLGLIFALCIGSYESWMMMLGRRGMDVMKLVRIVGISLCITFSSEICSGLAGPGRALERQAKAMAAAKNAQVDVLQQQVAELQDAYLERLQERVDSLRRAEKAEVLGADASQWDELVYSVKNLDSVIKDNLKQLAVFVETKFSEGFNIVVRFLGELIFQMTYYGLFLAQRCFMAILGVFCPLAFALSIVPPWSSAWSQWISKYLSISLWGWIIYVSLFYVDHLLIYNLQKDMAAYTYLVNNVNGSSAQIGALGMQGIGSNCFYVMGMMIGSYLLKFVPEVASWLIPGGVSSGIGGMIGGAAAGGVMSATKMVGGKTLSMAKSAVSGGSKLAGTMVTTGTKAVSQGFQGAKTGAQMGAKAGGGNPVLGTLGATAGMVVGAIGGAAAAVGEGAAKATGVGIKHSKVGVNYRKGSAMAKGKNPTGIK